ncbi:hypothetical protein CCGE531_06745 [Rhizobium sp. CCGE531]|nr:hypothetical protein CCGE531_06745 [Rhizobium sp. CCGE531]AYG72207.1 hypothetical protein CCGE532_06745 [Rhizobium sp. CCGE532]
MRLRFGLIVFRAFDDLDPLQKPLRTFWDQILDDGLAALSSILFLFFHRHCVEFATSFFYFAASS